MVRGMLKESGLKISLMISCGVMVIGTAVFMLVPEGLLSIFSNKAAVLEIGSHALRVISGKLYTGGGFYDAYGLFSGHYAGNDQYFYYGAAAGISACAAGMGVPLMGAFLCLADISCNGKRSRHPAAFFWPGKKI